jgi:hypothetical protein
VSATKPNLLIASAAKAGTTSLHEYLGQHPDIFMSTFKEPNHFVAGYAYDDWQKYLVLFAGARGETAETEAEFLQRHRDDIHQLEQLIDRDLSPWFSEQALKGSVSTPNYVSLR